VAVELSDQLLECGRSAGANYEEADDGSSSRDTSAKKKIALREMKEARFRLRIWRRCELLTAEHDPVIDESDELVRILATVIRNDSRRDLQARSVNAQFPPKRRRSTLVPPSQD
jgi:four helix bundle protein